MRNMQPKRGDRAKIVSHLPAKRYANRWAEVVRGGNSGNVVIKFPSATRISSMTMKAKDLVFYRGGRLFKF